MRITDWDPSRKVNHRVRSFEIEKLEQSLTGRSVRLE